MIISWRESLHAIENARRPSCWQYSQWNIGCPHTFQFPKCTCRCRLWSKVARLGEGHRPRWASWEGLAVQQTVPVALRSMVPLAYLVCAVRNVGEQNPTGAPTDVTTDPAKVRFDPPAPKNTVDVPV